MTHKVVVAVATEVVTVADVKANSRITISDDDALIERLIKVAREEAEQLTDRAIGEQTLLLTLDQFPADAIELPRPPLQSVSWVKYVDQAGTLQTVSSADYALDDQMEPSWVLPAYGVAWPQTQAVANAVRVQYVAGYSDATCPAAVKQWILMRVGSLYENREADSERTAMPVPFVDRLLDATRVWKV